VVAQRPGAVGGQRAHPHRGRRRVGRLLHHG
jgi:hypothetical protein